LPIIKPITHINNVCEFSEVNGYLYHKDSIFAVCQVKEISGDWWLVHRPTEHLFARFRSKRDVEKFLDFFLKELDEKDICLLTPMYSQVKEALESSFNIAYPRYWCESRR